MQPEQNQPVATPPKKSNAILWIVIGCGTILLIGALAFGGFMWWGYHKAKEVLKSDSADVTKMPELWSDVPKMPGMTESKHVDMPVAMKLLARPILDKMMSGVNDGKEAGHWDWTGYSISGRTAADVEHFYTSDRMAENGWQSEGGCTTMDAGFSREQPAFCAFQKQKDNKNTGLLIIATNDNEQNAVSVFFIRQESQETASNEQENATPVTTGSEPTLPVAPITISLDIKTIDVCRLIPKADIEAVLGRRLWR